MSFCALVQEKTKKNLFHSRSTQIIRIGRGEFEEEQHQFLNNTGVLHYTFQGVLKSNKPYTAT
jgi:hypothetical protein